VATPPTANEIKTQIKTLLTPVIGTSGTKKSKIFDYLALAFKPAEGEDPEVLRSSLDVATVQDGSKVKRINCLMISESGFGQAKVPRKEDSTRLIQISRGKNVISRQLFLTYFYQFGQASENVFSDNVEAIRKTLNSNQKLGFDVGGLSVGAGEFIEGHDLLQAPVIYVDFYGTTALHVAEGTLTVRVIEPLES